MASCASILHDLSMSSVFTLKVRNDLTKFLGKITISGLPFVHHHEILSFIAGFISEHRSLAAALVHFLSVWSLNWRIGRLLQVENDIRYTGYDLSHTQLLIIKCL
jgi:hypothetical protein